MTKSLWFWPIVIALLTAMGLVLGLVSDGWGDVIAWVGLATPITAAMLSFRRGKGCR